MPVMTWTEDSAGMRAATKKRLPYPWFMRWSRVDVVKRGNGYRYRVTFTPTGAVGEGVDRDEAVSALAAVFERPEADCE